MSSGVRLDAALVARGLCASRTVAQKVIAQGRVKVTRPGKPAPEVATKSSLSISDIDVLEVLADEADRFVSRGALKLLGALDTCGISPQGLRCLDVGQSTGGFTDVLLQQGASLVLGVDVGHGQLHPKLQHDPRTLCLEGLNARECSRELLAQRLIDASCNAAPWLPEMGYDLVVMDVSFISLLKVSPALQTVMHPGSDGLWLVKPQFEVGATNLGKGGLVKPEALGPAFETGICTALEQQGYQVKQFFTSPIVGGDGNTEYFVWVSPES